ncbi:hypothetical protein [Amycolatopsis sp. cmx-4-83]|uniref:hypothetical protein n=1 Tax=Amycolatopsis sp. cmx-4-83 TaxID=2790940 RepID=UPI00397C90EC
MTRMAWIEAAKRVSEGAREELRCPENDDDFLAVEWLPNPGGVGGEYRLHCPSCGAENWILKRLTAQ